MILACPTCETRFQLPPGASLPAGGRKVRCAACATTWRAYPEPDPTAEPAPDLAADPFAEPVPEPFTDPFADLDADAAVAAADPGIDPFAELAGLDPAPARSAARRPAPAARAAPGRSLHILGAWAAGGVGAAVLLAGAAAGVAREQTVAFWPQTATLFAWVGLPTTVSGLAFADLRAAPPEDAAADHAELLVAGTIRNLRAVARTLEPLRIGVADAGGIELGHWVVDLGGAEAPPRGPVAFTVALPAPPPGAATVTVRPAVAEDGQPTVIATTASAEDRSDAPPEAPAAEAGHGAPLDGPDAEDAHAEPPPH